MMKYMKDNICRKFCHYYKPSKDEDLACLGFSVSERLMKRGMKCPSEMPLRRPYPDTEHILVRSICIRCPFYEEDCDYVTEYRGKKGTEYTAPGSNIHEEGIGNCKGNPPPCGGFIFLGLLLELKIICIDDIINMV